MVSPNGTMALLTNTCPCLYPAQPGSDGTLAFTATLVPKDVPGCGTEKVLYVGAPGALQGVASVQIPTEEAVGKPTDLGPDEPYVTPRGWVAFILEVSGVKNLSVWDGQATLPVAATGATIGGWTITDLDLAGEDSPGATALGGRGQLVFRAFAGKDGSQSEIVLASLAGTQPPAALPAWLAQPPATQGGANGAAGPSAGGPGGRPVVTALSPSSGSDWGGEPITISGSGFTAAATVTFGEYNPATLGQVSADGTQMTVTTPPHLDGAVDVTVTTAAGASPATDADRFTYQPPSPGAHQGG